MTNKPNPADLSIAMMIASAADLSELMSGHSVEDVIDVLLNESRLHLPGDLKRVHGPTDGPYTTREEIEPDMQAKASMEAIALNGKVRQAHEAGDLDGVFFYTAQLISAVIRSRAHNTYRKGAAFKPGRQKGALNETNAYLLKVMRGNPDLSNQGIADHVWNDQSPESPYYRDERELYKKQNDEHVNVDQLISVIEQVRSRYFSDT